jgi:hypothetical protein
MNKWVAFHAAWLAFFFYVGIPHVSELHSGVGDYWDFFMALVSGVGIYFAFDSAREAWT